MFDFVKKTLAFGLGAALLTGEKLRQVADEAVAKGEMSKEEAKSFIDEVTDRAEQEKVNMETWMKDQMTRMMREMGIARHEELEALKKRIDAIEFRLDAAEMGSFEHEEIT